MIIFIIVNNGYKDNGLETDTEGDRRFINKPELIIRKILNPKYNNIFSEDLMSFILKIRRIKKPGNIEIK